ncbi:uncharacterized protein BKA55DRAFT_212000 [Fusarium redolens]|uniref:Uncharacterized protein n=1 Tax=Fusarium redolens TaxID=48865 RepID=A0A9P9FYZ4_FUSRE|nr:uncharacterized protein BKA55DRAFT_212000 [Fusarium redolens]KAH7227089.1 hypothetical protein BKA55DRAFT_212000 [Fusarium redolens]
MEIQLAHSSVTRQIIIFPILIIVFIAISRSAPNYSPFLIHLHDALTEFSAGGQLTLELFAPLSATLGPSQPTVEILTSTCRFPWALVAAAFFQVSKMDDFLTAGSLYKESVLYCLFFGTVMFWSDLIGPNHILALVSNSFPLALHQKRSSLMAH